MRDPTDPLSPDNRDDMPDAPDEVRPSAPDDTSRESASHDRPTAAKGERPTFARRNWGKLTIAAFVGAPLIVFALWTVVGLNYVYSRGTRAGFVQKISKKGWLCKTWEGEMAISTIPGSMPQLFTFSVRSDSVAAAIEATNGKRIVISYEEKPWIPTSCFGETAYFVNGVRVVGSAPEPE